jgi:hypothetical protein
MGEGNSSYFTVLSSLHIGDLSFGVDWRDGEGRTSEKQLRVLRFHITPPFNFVQGGVGVDVASTAPERLSRTSQNRDMGHPAILFVTSCGGKCGR